MDQGLKAIISADGSQFTKTFDDLQNDLKAFETQLKRTQSVDAFDKLSIKINDTKKALEALKNVSANAGLDKVSGSSNRATAALTDLSRVAQDAPYGFIGIANNLNPMLESFQRLQRESGGTKAALQSLVAGLTGPAGIGLAIGVVSSLLVAFAQNQQKAEEATTDAAKGINSAADAIAGAQSKYVEAVTNVSRLREEVSLAKDGFIDKEKVVREYNSTIGEAIGKVQTLDQVEKALANNAQAYIRFTLLKAAANIALGEAAKKAFEAASSDFKAEDLAKPVKRGLLDEPDPYNIQGRIRKAGEILFRGKSEVAKKEQDTLTEISNGLFKKAAELAKANHFDFFEGDFEPKITKSSDNVQKELAELDAAFAKFAKVARTETVGAAKDFQDIISSMILNRQPLKLPKMDNAVLDEYRDASKLMTSFRKQFNELGLDLPNIRVGDVGGVDGLNKQFEKLLENAQTINSLIGSSLTPAFEDMFSTIFAGGDGLQSFFQTLGQSVQQLIAKLIAAQIQALLLSVLTGLALPKTGGGIPMRGRITGIGGAAGFGGMSSLGALGGVARLSAQGGGRMGSTPGGISVNVGVTGSLRGNGRDLVAVISNTTQRQGRNF